MSQFAGAFPAPTWTPPARAPFVPLRPLTLGQVLSGAIRALRSNPTVAVGRAILASVGATVVGAATSWFLIDPTVDAIGSSSLPSALYRWLDSYGAGLISWIVLQSAVLAAGLVQQGVAGSLVSHAVIGRKLTPQGLRRRTKGMWGRQFAWMLLVFVVLVALGLVGVALIGMTQLASPAFAVLVGMFVHGVGVFVLVWLGTKLAVVPSAIAVERIGVRQAVGRSWRLTRRNFWRTFGTRILCWTMIWLSTMLISLPIMLLVQLLGSILAGNGDISDYLTIEQLGSFVIMLASAVVGAIGLVITTSCDALIYLDLRMRGEGLDLELARFMEVRRPGTRHDPNEVDPFRGPDAVTATAQKAAW